MRKITKLSLVACLAVGTIASADMKKAMDETKVTAELKAQYFIKDNPGNTADTDTIGVVGGNVGVVTGSMAGFKLGATLQGTATVMDDIENNTNSYADFMDATGVVLSEAYLSYGMNKTELKIGRQYIGTPLVAGSGSRMIKQSFEAVTLATKAIENTTIVAGYVTKFQDRTDGDEKPGTFEKVGDGAITLYVKNNSVKNLTLQAQYLVMKDDNDTKVQYVDASYNMGGATVSAQYLGSKTDGADAASLLGLKVSGNIGMVNATGIYTTTGDKGTVTSGAGGAADKSFAALPLHGGVVTYFANTDTMVGILASKISGVTVAGYYGLVDSPDSNNAYGAKEIKAFGGFAQYAFNKNFSAKVMYESADFNTLSEDSNRFRIYTSYKF